MEIEYPARIVKHGNGYYVKVGREARDILGLDRDDFVKVIVSTIKDPERPRRDSNPVSEFWEEYERFEPSDRNRAVEEAIHSHEHALTT